MDSYHVFLDLGIILISAKFFGILAKKLKVPQVVGEIIAGLLIGPCVLGLVKQSDFLSTMAEIGVILLMFSTGLDTDLKELKKTGLKAFLVASCGVIVPLIGGTILFGLFYGFGSFGSEAFMKAVFIGCIMTATSVSITVAALRDMGKLQGTVGTTILSAAIIDDVLGIIVLTIVISFKDPSANLWMVLLKTALFFVFAVICGILVNRLFTFLDKKYPHTQRIPIAGLAFCFFMAFISEQFFGVADVTGAYIAGLTLSTLKDASYIERKMDISSYMVFSPIFFASIGLKTNISQITPQIIVFSLAFIAVALVTKIIGCGGISLLCKFNKLESLQIGVGMMTRGEVALIVAQKGLSLGLVDSVYFTSVILLIITSSIVTPLFLKVLFSKSQETSLEAANSGSKSRNRN